MVTMPYTYFNTNSKEVLYMFKRLFKPIIILDEEKFKDLCLEIENELREKIKQEYKSERAELIKKLNAVKVEYNTLERKYSSLQQSYDILAAHYAKLKNRNNELIQCSEISRAERIAGEIFGEDE